MAVGRTSTGMLAAITGGRAGPSGGNGRAGCARDRGDRARPRVGRQFLHVILRAFLAARRAVLRGSIGAMAAMPERCQSGGARR